MSDPLIVAVVVLVPVLAALLAVELWAAKRGGEVAGVVENAWQTGVLGILILAVAGRRHWGLVGEGGHLDAVLAGGLLVLLTLRVGFVVRALSSLPAPRKVRLAWPFVVVPLLVYVAILPWAAHQRAPDGDEPYFLLITHSLVHDFDTELGNNYDEEHSLLFTSRALEPEWADPVLPDGRRYSRHSVLLPTVLAPGYALAGKWGAMLTMAGIAALVAGLSLRLALRWWGLERWRESVWVWALLALTPPMLLYSHQIWTELPAALLVLLALHRIRDLQERRPDRNKSLRPWLELAVLLAALPLLKLRFAVLAASLLVLAWWRSGGRRRTLVWAAVALTVAVGGLLLFNLAVFDKPFKDHTTSQLLQIQGRAPLDYLQGLTGLFWDCAFGLLSSNPFWLLLVPALVLALRRRPPELLDLGLCVAPYLMLVAPRREWYGAWAPPFRFGMVLLPLLALLLVPLLARRQQAGARLLVAGLGVFALSLLLLWVIVPGWTYNLAVGTDHVIDHLSLRLAADVGRFFPSLVRPRTASWLVPAFGLVLALVLWWVPRRRPQLPVPWAVGGVLLILAALPLAALRVPTAVIEFEDRQVGKSGGELYPGPWVPFRPQFRGGWKLAAGEGLRAPLVTAGESLLLELDVRSRGRAPETLRLTIWADETAVGELLPGESRQWQTLDLEVTEWPPGADLRIAVSGSGEGDGGAHVILDRARLSWR